MLTNNIMLAINGRDTLRPLGIYLKLFANSVHDIKYHKQCCQIMVSETHLTFLHTTFVSFERTVCHGDVNLGDLPFS